MYKIPKEVDELAAKRFKANPKTPLLDEKKMVDNDALYNVYF
jgi:hypothetical protein